MTTTLKTDLDVGDIVLFHEGSFGWTYPHGPGPGPQNIGAKGLVVDATESNLAVVLLKWETGLSDWDNVLFYGDGSAATVADDATYDIAGVWQGSLESADEGLYDLVRGLAVYTKIHGSPFDAALGDFYTWWVEPYTDDLANLPAAGTLLKSIFNDGWGADQKGALLKMVEAYEPTPKDIHTLYLGCINCEVTTELPGREGYCASCALGGDIQGLFPIHDQPELLWGFVQDETGESEATHALYRYLFEGIIQQARIRLGHNETAMRDVREITTDVDLGGYAAYYQYADRNLTLYELADWVRQAIEWVVEQEIEWVVEGERAPDFQESDPVPDLNPESLLDVIESMQSDRVYRDKKADQLLAVWGRSRQGVAVRGSTNNEGAL